MALCTRGHTSRVQREREFLFRPVRAPVPTAVRGGRPEIKPTTGTCPSFGVFGLVCGVYGSRAAHALRRAWIRTDPTRSRATAVGRDDAGVGARGRPDGHGLRGRLRVRLVRAGRLGRGRRRGRGGGGGGLRHVRQGPRRGRLGRRRRCRGRGRRGARARLRGRGRRRGRRGRGRPPASTPTAALSSPTSAALPDADADAASRAHPAAETDAPQADASRTDPARTAETEARPAAPRAGADPAARGGGRGTPADARGEAEAETPRDPAARTPLGETRQLPGVPPAGPAAPGAFEHLAGDVHAAHHRPRRPRRGRAAPALTTAVHL